LVLSWNHPAAGSRLQPDDQLIQAATNGDTATVQQLLDQGANIEAKAEMAHGADFGRPTKARRCCEAAAGKRR